MDSTEYFWLTRKKEPKTKPKSRPLPKATQKYLEAEEEFTEALDNLEIKYEKKFQFKSTKHWRFDFHLIEHHILVEIAGGPWSGGRKGKLKNKAWSLDRYDVAEEMGYKIERFHPDSVLSGYVINWIKDELARIEDGADQTISTD
ncbi:hypothetical protein M0H91_002410 [Acinetobacter baumannii]|nr:hypothetical protein [Acinetobacter baumannii]EKU3885141.1 hypothetical protein [Acinetobacter baumannii]EKV4358442.1 hypothetical protein [Acinetobacter baumannii]EKX9098550.1 hypothetical protein [Acinetobacter baumannii]EKX9222929.1 hypothetical protein [Acinetobacter baumannii]